MQGGQGARQHPAPSWPNSMQVPLRRCSIQSSSRPAHPLSASSSGTTRLLGRRGASEEVEELVGRAFMGITSPMCVMGGSAGAPPPPPYSAELPESSLSKVEW